MIMFFGYSTYILLRVSAPPTLDRHTICNP